MGVVVVAVLLVGPQIQSNIAVYTENIMVISQQFIGIIKYKVPVRVPMYRIPGMYHNKLRLGLPTYLLNTAPKLTSVAKINYILLLRQSCPAS